MRQNLRINRDPRARANPLPRRWDFSFPQPFVVSLSLFSSVLFKNTKKGLLSHQSSLLGALVGGRWALELRSNNLHILDVVAQAQKPGSS